MIVGKPRTVNGESFVVRACDHAGCKATNDFVLPARPATIYTTEKGDFCARHFGGVENIARQMAPEADK